MNTIKLKFFKSFLLKDFSDYPIDCPLGKGGIYFHYIKVNEDNYRIIYVGKCESFQLRQKEHLSYYNKNKYSLFDVDKKGELNITYIPDYDRVTEELKEMKEKTVSRLFVICGIIEGLEKNIPEDVEGAIINELYRNSETRKFLLNTKTRWTLRNTEILLEGMESKLYCLKDKIIVP